MGLLRVSKGAFYPLRALEVRHNQRGGQQRKQQLSYGKVVRNRREGEGFHRQQDANHQPDNIVLWHVMTAFKEGDRQPEGVITHSDKRQEGEREQRDIRRAHLFNQTQGVRRQQDVTKFN